MPGEIHSLDMDRQFRSDLLNIFNHPKLALPNVTVNSSAFGAIAITTDAVANGNPLGDGGTAPGAIRAQVGVPMCGHDSNQRHQSGRKASCPAMRIRGLAYYNTKSPTCPL
jgi:hypothetical protein